MRRIGPLLAALAIVLAPNLATAAELVGKVVRVSDGDTITVVVERIPHRVRLNAIDAPEIGQPFSAQSKKALSDLVFDQTVSVGLLGKDKYGREIGDVLVEGTSVNERMIADGWAWHFVKYSDSAKLAKLEVEARMAKRGLWADGVTPISPWDWRATAAERREKAKAANAAKRAEQAPTASKPGTFSRERTSLAPVVERSVKETPLSHWLNTSSSVRHNSSCQWYRDTKSGRMCGPDEGRGCKKCGG